MLEKKYLSLKEVRTKQSGNATRRMIKAVCLLVVAALIVFWKKDELVRFESGWIITGFTGEAILETKEWRWSEVRMSCAASKSPFCANAWHRLSLRAI